MRIRLAIRLRKLANRLDPLPPPQSVTLPLTWSASSLTATQPGTYTYVTWPQNPHECA
jgi:hypothetical protein